MSATVDPAQTGALAAALRGARHALPEPAALPADWCPDQPAAERIARLLLGQRLPAGRWDLVDPADVRGWLAHTGTPGHRLPDVMAERDRLLAEETVRVRAVLGYLVEVTGLAQIQLGELVVR